MKISTMIMVVFAIAFLPRILTAIGLPTILNFIHFIGVGLLFFITKPWDSKELRPLVIALAVLIATIILSASLNGTGTINVILEILLFCEPFMFLIAIMSNRWTLNSLLFFKRTLALLCFFHIALSLFQFFILGYSGDDVKGVFLNMGAGHHVGGAVSIGFGIYWFTRYRYLSLANRSTVFFLSLITVLMADAKQVLAVSIIAFGLFSFFSKFHFWKSIKRISYLATSIGMVFLIGKTIYPPLLNWATSSRFIPAITQKFSVFNIITDNYDNSMCWLFGLGPGHTTSRLALLMNEYGDWLYSLGATTSPLTSVIFFANQSNWMSNSVTGSSLFSLMFSWAGIWGDIGLVGVAAYIGCWLIILQKYCTTPLARYLIFCIFIYGITFTWLEEPAFMLFMASILGITWQENKYKSTLTANNNPAKQQQAPHKDACVISP